jgi:ATP-binding cassette, subfamily B (MDR/TAP), member 1
LTYFSFLLLVDRVIAFVFMSAQATLLETAAGEMTLDLKTRWFKALLRQDLAYYDVKDVSGTATMISSNGAKYRK